MARPPSADSLLRNAKRKPEFQTPIATEMFVPNHSGDLSAGHVGTPSKDLDLANKKYVDDSVAAVTPVDHTDTNDVINVGTNTHAQIDTHIATTSGNPHGVKLNEVDNPDGDKTFNMTTRQLKFLWTNPAGNPMELESSGAYTGSLLHIHQHTGNPGSTYLLELEASDTDVEHISSTGAATTTHSYCAYVSGDSSERWVLHCDGKMEWGDGSSQDTNLYRGAANKLMTDDTFECDALYVNNTEIVGTDGEVNASVIEDKFLRNDASDTTTGTITAAQLTTTGDNSSADTAYTPMVLYNTDATPPAASGFPIGTIYVQYTA